MRAAIYGAGAMGTVLGAYIWKNGGKIDLISRNAAHVETLNSRGAKIIGGANFTQAVNAVTPEQMQGEYDIILLMTKQRDNAEILKFLKNYLKADGVVCTLQNGVPERSVAEAVGEERCLGCAVTWGASLVEAGVARLSSKPEKMSFALGAYGAVNPLINEVKNILNLAGSVTVEQNFIGARWTKLVINSAFSSLSALTGMRFCKLAKGKRAYAALGIMHEAFSVAESAGIAPAKIQGHDIKALYYYKNSAQKLKAKLLLPFLVSKHKQVVSGMYYDLSSGKVCDIDYVAGAVIKLGKKFGVRTPLCEKAVSAAHAIERGELKISEENLKLFY